MPGSKAPAKTPAKAEETSSSSAIIRKPDTASAIATVDRMITDRRAELVGLMANDPAMFERLRTLTSHALADPKLLAKLVKADLATVYLAVRECASLGLMPISTLAEAYFVPYWNRDKGAYDVELQAGYNGLTKLVRNSGRVLDVGAGVAYEGDVFDYDEGSAAFVRHKRALSGRGKRIAAYAIAWLPGGVVRVRVMDNDEIELHRLASKADSGPWVDWYDAMAAKTVLRDLCKQLPKSASVERALMLDVDAEERHSGSGSSAPIALPSGVARIQAHLGLPIAVPEGGSGSESTPAPDPAGHESGSLGTEAEPDSPAIEIVEGQLSLGEPSDAPRPDPDLAAGMELLNDRPSNAGVHL